MYIQYNLAIICNKNGAVVGLLCKKKIFGWYAIKCPAKALYWYKGEKEKMTVQQPNLQTGLIDECLLAVSKGSLEALEQLYQLTRGAVYSYALSVTKNVHEAEDVLHDTYVTVYQKAVQYKSRSKPMAWILTIAKNLCYQRFRQKGRFCDITDDQIERYFSSDSRISQEDRLTILACLQQLTDEQRQIVVLHSVSGLKHREIAKLLDLPLSTVLSKYNRAIGKLKSIFMEENK